MAIKKETNFENQKFYLDDRERAAAYTAITSNWNGIILSGSITIANTASVGQLFVTSSAALPGDGTYDVICIKK